MNLPLKKTVKSLLQSRKITPSKGLGQHFLVDNGVLAEIIKAAELTKEDTVLEIGPGPGVLTLQLAKRAKKVIAVEKDRKMCEMLKEMLEGWKFKNVEVINDDILQVRLPNIVNGGRSDLLKYKVVANLPYYIASPVIRKFLEHAENGSLYVPTMMVLMVQKEVAQRICPAYRQAGAKPPKMSLLAVSVQFYAEPKIIDYVSRKSFWPIPKVDSAIIKITPKFDRNSTIARNLPNLFFKVVKAGFSHPRKQLINNLSTGLKLDREFVKKWLLDCVIKPEQRPETLSVEDWIRLAKTAQKL